MHSCPQKNGNCLNKGGNDVRSFIDVLKVISYDLLSILYVLFWYVTYIQLLYKLFNMFYLFNSEE